jgi:elongation factor P
VPISINQIKSGLTIELNGEVYVIQEYQHVKPGKGAAFVRVKVRNLATDAVFDKTFKSDDKLTEAYVDERKLIYQYRTSDTFHFMDRDNYEEVIMHKEKIEHEIPYLKDNLEVSASFYKHRLLRLNLPTFIEFEVVETEPGIKGDTVKSGTKPAKLETGLVVQVPLFINTSDKLKIDTRTGTYVERVSR